jgi:hypothetical protein
MYGYAPDEIVGHNVSDVNYAGFVAEETAGLPEVRHDAEQIQAAATRAARLTRQLALASKHSRASTRAGIVC